jgi:predicted  nucleic acid-binding Zn-ribbon protein
VERSIRVRYDRLRAVRATAVVVPLRGEACGACFTAVPRNRRSQIRAGILLDNCEACGVILYADAPN